MITATLFEPARVWLRRGKLGRSLAHASGADGELPRALIHARAALHLS